MHFVVDQHFAAPLATTVALFTDMDFYRGLTDLSVVRPEEVLSYRRTGDVVRFAIRYRLVQELLPVVYKFVERDKITWVEESTMNVATAHGMIVLTPDHYASLITSQPGRVTFTESAHGQGTHRRLQSTFHVGGTVPVLLRRPGDRAIVTLLKRHLRQEEIAARAELARRAAPA